MQAHLVQFDIAWENPDANYAAVERLLDAADVRERDVVLLPEMFDSGFSFNTAVTADREGRTLAFLKRLAGDLGVYVHGSRTIHECHCTKATNRATIIGPDGEPMAEYSKIHPFTFGKENDAFMGGHEVVTYDWAGGETLRICPAICYDLRFPELFRLGLAKGAQLFALGANWPSVRAAHWRALLIARAIENQAFVLGVNRTGNDPNLAYGGGSMAVSPTGEILGELGAEAGVLTVTIEPATLHEWRAKFPAWRDGKLMPSR